MAKQPTDVTASPRKRAPGAGRPPEGEHGGRVADYPRLAVRLPPVTTAKLKAWADVSGVPMWKLIADSVEASIDSLQGADAADVRRLAKRYVSRYRPE